MKSWLFPFVFKFQTISELIFSTALLRLRFAIAVESELCGTAWKCDSTLCVGTVPPTHNQRNTPVTEALQVQPSPSLPPALLSFSFGVSNSQFKHPSPPPPPLLPLSPFCWRPSAGYKHYYTPPSDSPAAAVLAITLSSLLFQPFEGRCERLAHLGSEMKPSRRLLPSLQNRGCRGGLLALKVPQLWRG